MNSINETDEINEPISWHDVLTFNQREDQRRINDINGIHIDQHTRLISFGIHITERIDPKFCSPKMADYKTLTIKIVPLMRAIDQAINRFNFLSAVRPRVRVIVGRSAMKAAEAPGSKLPPGHWEAFYRTFTYQNSHVQLVGWARGITVIPEQP